MSNHATFQKARKDYRCEAEWAHDPTIRKGSIYARVTYFPSYLEAGKPSEPIFFHEQCFMDGIDQ